MMIVFFLLFSALEFEADKMESLREGAGRTTHLIGNVHLYEENLDIRGTEAWFKPAEQSFIVYDSLRIKAQDADITADSLWFETENRISHLYRRVIVKKGNTEIRAPQITIYHRTRTAKILYGAQIRDLKEGILITGDDVSYDLGKDRGSVLRNPILREERDSSDFRITSERMHIDQGARAASAAGKVRILTEDATVHCDTLVLFYEKDTGHAFGNTAIESPEGRIEADSADFRLAGRNLEEIFLYPDVVTRYRTEGQDSVVVHSPYLTIDLSKKNAETLIFTGGTSGTYFWREAEPRAEE
jgi:lipopolysaccharide assembly outer membrane protein LptD (OstA)